MKKTTVLFTFCMIGILVLTACGPVEAFPAPQETGQVATSVPGSTLEGATPLPPTGTDTGGAVEGQSTITLEDNGKTFNLHVGEGFLLKLGEGYDWQINISDQNVLSRVKNMAVIRGAQGIYQALKPGTVSVSATGDPECRKSRPACGMPSILVEFTVVVK